MSHAPYIAILSDLHLEFDRDLPHMRRLLKGRRRLAPTPVDDDGHPLYGPRLEDLRAADLVVAVGDIDVKTWSVPWLDAASRYTGCPWVYVPGNHEYYGRPLENALRDLRSACAGTAGRITLLDDEQRDFMLRDRRVAVLGCTLWTDYRLFGDEHAQEAREHCQDLMNDHRYIRRAGGAGRWLADDAARTHAASRSWLTDALPAARASADVVAVATHHAPMLHPAPLYSAETLEMAAYASDLTDLMTWEHAPDLWAHGHIHTPTDVVYGRTRVVAAPRGYPGSPTATNWTPRLITVRI